MKRMIFIYCFLGFCLHSCNDKRGSIQQNSDKTIAPADERYAQDINKGIAKDTIKKSIQRHTSAIIGSNEISIHYFSPGVKGRVIWGGLVPYNQVWVTGAHSATKLSFSKDMVFGNTRITAGSYALFTIPAKKEWTFILNRNFEQHLTDDYSKEEDMVRMNILPEVIKDTVQRLTYEIKKQGEATGNIIMSWETLQLSIPFNVLNTTGNAMSVQSKKLSGIKTDEKRDPVCYMPVTAGITDTTTYRKKLYGFCSMECKRLFLIDPGAYVAKTIK